MLPSMFNISSSLSKGDNSLVLNNSPGVLQRRRSKGRAARLASKSLGGSKTGNQGAVISSSNRFSIKYLASQIWATFRIWPSRWVVVDRIRGNKYLSAKVSSLT